MNEMPRKYDRAAVIFHWMKMSLHLCEYKKVDKQPIKMYEIHSHGDRLEL